MSTSTSSWLGADSEGEPHCMHLDLALRDRMTIRFEDVVHNINNNNDFDLLLEEPCAVLYFVAYPFSSRQPSTALCPRDNCISPALAPPPSTAYFSSGKRPFV